MKPSAYYHEDVARNTIQADPAQAQVLINLDQLYEQLQDKSAKFAWLSKWFSTSKQTRLKSQGIYLWGKVGRGKTYLMDTFYKSITIPKIRLHFYEFMAYVHAELKGYQGQAEPLKLVAEALIKKASLLCFDEFFVEDIADAMILGGLFQHLFTLGMVIVTTSNVAPDDLYKAGLQRDRFLPAIAMIKSHMRIMYLEHSQDYRMTKALQDHRYHSPLDNANVFLEAQFNLLNQGSALLPNSLTINQRNFTAIKRCAKIIWFEFSELCIANRSSLDYLKLCQSYKVIMLNHVPALNSNLEDAARRFMTLVDTCYDQQVLLVIAAEVALDDLYQGTHLNFEFARVKSRITEMQSWQLRPMSKS